MSGPTRAQFEFGRYGKILLILALLAGLWLSQPAFSCFIKVVAGYEIGAVVDDDTNTALVDDTGVVRDGIKGDYAENINRGTGIFGYVFGAAGTCIDRSSFDDPLPVWYAFMVLLGLGLLFMVLDRFITPNWKQGVRESAAQARDVAEDRPDRLPREGTPRRQTIQPLDVDLDAYHSGAPASPTPVEATSPPSPGRPSSSDTGQRLRPGVAFTPPAENARNSNDDDPFGFKTHDPFDVKRPTGPQRGGSRLSGSVRRPDALVTPIESEAISHSGGYPAVVTGHRADLSTPFGGTLSEATASDSVSRFDDFALADTMVPEEGQEDAFRGALGEQRSAAWTIPSGVWVPQNWGRGPIVYVAPETANHNGPSTGTNPGEPLFGLSEAVVTAQRFAQEGHRVQIRMLPGTYAERITLPPNVALINHRLPPADDEEGLRGWLQTDREQSEVLLTAPPHIGAEDYLLNLDGSHEALVAGIRFSGLASSSAGRLRYGGAVHVLSTRSARFYLCAFAHHVSAGDGAALRVEQGGDLQKKHSILFEHCLFEDNQAGGRGGALFAHDSITVFRACTFRKNRSAVAGGAVYVQEAPIPMLFEDGTLCDNLVETGEPLPDASRSGWSGEVGHGGAIYASYSGVHLRRCDLLNNRSAGAGGAIFAFASRLLLEGGTADDDRPSGRIAENQAQRGGAVMLSGLRPDSDMQRFLTAMRATGVELSRNRAHESGGAIATFRMAVLDLKDCRCQRNAVTSEHGEGGAIHATVGSRLKLTRTHILKNRAPFRGGGMSVSNSSLRIHEGCSVCENQSERGEFAGIAFYTTYSRLLIDLKSSDALELPVVCAIAPCEINRNRSKGGVAGLFIGCLEDKPSIPIVYAVKAPDLITHNVVARVVAQRKLGPRPPGRRRPENLMVVWAKRVMANDTRPPEGKQQLVVPKPSSL
ncbi:MAG: hypothetical protein AAFX99_17255 [Myxococcota bacterium]